MSYDEFFVLCPIKWNFLLNLSCHMLILLSEGYSNVVLFDIDVGLCCWLADVVLEIVFDACPMFISHPYSGLEACVAAL